jgi:hypothetical protein
VIHLYAFTPPGARLPSTGGIGGAGLEACRVADVVAVVSVLEDATTGREAVLAHGLVVEALREETGAVLPARFGERFTDRSQLIAAVGDRVATLREGLARVRGCAEFGVRMVTGHDADGTPASDGSTYMRSRLASVAREEAFAAELHEPLARCSRASTVSAGSDYAAAYLVGDEERSGFERALAGFVAAHPDLTVVCTGPWAPYSFVEAGGE